MLRLHCTRITRRLRLAVFLDYIGDRRGLPFPTQVVSGEKAAANVATAESENSRSATAQRKRGRAGAGHAPLVFPVPLRRRERRSAPKNGAEKRGARSSPSLF